MRPFFDERPALAALAEAERFEPRQREEREAVVELRGVDVLRLEIGARPHVRRGVARRHRGDVFPLIPQRPLAHRRADGVEAHRAVRQVARYVRARDDTAVEPSTGASQS